MTLSTSSPFLSKNSLTVRNATSQASLRGNLQAPVPMQGNAFYVGIGFLLKKLILLLIASCCWSWGWDRICSISAGALLISCCPRVPQLIWHLKNSIQFDLSKSISEDRKKKHGLAMYYVQQEVCGQSWGQLRPRCSHFSAHAQHPGEVQHICGSTCPLKRYN